MASKMIYTEPLPVFNSKANAKAWLAELARAQAESRRAT